MNKNVKYVQQKRVAPLLNDMVCHLVTTFPEDPLEGLIYYLEKRFPDVAESAAQKTGIPVGQTTTDPNSKVAAPVEEKRVVDGTLLIPTPPRTHQPTSTDPHSGGKSPHRPIVGGPLALTIPRGSKTTLGTSINTPRDSLTGSVSYSASATMGGPSSPMFGKEVHHLIDQLRENEELMMGAIVENRKGLTAETETEGGQSDRLAALKSEGFSVDLLDVLSTIESNYRSGQVAINTAYFGDGKQDQTPQVLLQRLADNEAAFTQLLSKAERSSSTGRKEKSQLEEAIEKSAEIQQLLLEMSVGSTQTADIVYNVLYRKALGAVANETDPNKLLAMLEGNESAFLGQISAARKTSTSVIDRALLTTAEQRGVALLNTIEDLRLNAHDLNRCLENAALAAVGGMETTGQAHRVIHELKYNEELFLDLLTDAAKVETNPQVRKMLQTATFASEDTLEVLQGVESTAADVELSFAAHQGSLSADEITALRALRMIQALSVEHEKMRAKVHHSLQHQADSQIIANGNHANTMNPGRGGGVVENYAEMQAIEQILQGQKELQELLVTAQERELVIEQALGRGNRGLRGAVQENALQLHDALKRIKMAVSIEEGGGGASAKGSPSSGGTQKRAVSRLMGQTSGSPVVTLVEMLMASVDLVANALEQTLDVKQRVQMTHLQVSARKTCLVAQLLPEGDQSTAATKRLFTESQKLAEAISAFYGTLSPEHKGLVVGLKQQTEIVRDVQGFCKLGAVTEALLVEG